MSLLTHALRMIVLILTNNAKQVLYALLVKEHSNKEFKVIKTLFLISLLYQLSYPQLLHSSGGWTRTNDTRVNNHKQNIAVSVFQVLMQDTMCKILPYIKIAVGILF